MIDPSRNIKATARWDGRPEIGALAAAGAGLVRLRNEFQMTYQSLLQEPIPSDHINLVLQLRWMERDCRRAKRFSRREPDAVEGWK